MEMLKRNSSATNEDLLDYCDLLKGDENELESINLDLLQDPRLRQFSERLADRFEAADSVDLEKIWFDLTAEEQKEFVDIVNGNEKLFDELIQQWRPWWLRMEWQQAVTDQDEGDEDPEEDARPFPVFFTQFERISKLTSVC